MIEITNVNFRYAGPEPAGVKDIHLCIPDGECLLLCGASGCGKTTITRLINGLIPHFYKGELSLGYYDLCFEKNRGEMAA